MCGERNKVDLVGKYLPCLQQCVDDRIKSRRAFCLLSRLLRLEYVKVTKARDQTTCITISFHMLGFGRVPVSKHVLRKRHQCPSHSHFESTGLYQASWNL